MKLRIIALTLFLSVLAFSCSKDDFDDLLHPIVVEGAFDPVYGLPIASMSANMGTLVGMFDTNTSVSVYIGGDDVVSLRYSYYNHTRLQWDVEQSKSIARSKGLYDTIHEYSTLHGTQYIDLFDKIEGFDIDNVGMDVLYVSVNTFLKAYVNSTLQSLVEKGVSLAFDSIHVTIICKDGHREELPLMPNVDKVNVGDIVDGRNFTILDQYDVWGVVRHKPVWVEYTVRMCMGIPIDQLWDIDPTQPVNYLDSIAVDSIAADIYADFDLPLKFYCQDIAYSDTLPLNASSISDLTDNLRDDTLVLGDVRLTLNDTNCYIALAAENYLPLELLLDVEFLDAAHRPLATSLIQGDRSLYGAPLEPVPGASNVYQANGYSSSLLRIHLDLHALKELAKAEYVAFHIGANTSTLGATTPRPNVAIKKHDRLDLRAYIVFSPHADFSIPLTGPINIFNNSK